MSDKLTINLDDRREELLLDVAKDLQIKDLEYIKEQINKEKMDRILRILRDAKEKGPVFSNSLLGAEGAKKAKGKKKQSKKKKSKKMKRKKNLKTKKI